MRKRRKDKNGKEMKVLLKGFLILTIAALAGCGSNESASGMKIIGTVDQVVEDGWVSLERIGEQGAISIDTVEIGADGKYSLSATIDA
ncbi:MAG: hypothetical protein ABJP45_05545, partial [Cyclobacteriaceae bacterium]